MQRVNPEQAVAVIILQREAAGMELRWRQAARRSVTALTCCSGWAGCSSSSLWPQPAAGSISCVWASAELDTLWKKEARHLEPIPEHSQPPSAATAYLRQYRSTWHREHRFDASLPQKPHFGWSGSKLSITSRLYVWARLGTEWTGDSR